MKPIKSKTGVRNATKQRMTLISAQETLRIHGNTLPADLMQVTIDALSAEINAYYRNGGI